MSARLTLYRLAALLALLPLGGCYVLQAAHGQYEVMRRSEPISAVLADATTAPKTRAGLELVAAARSFAVDELGLPDSRSYLSYADLGRPYVVFNVVATDEFAVEPRRWCFLVAGCVAYRGYFDEQRARDFALKLSIRGADVSVGGVPTYSTLGHLPDPVFSPMLQWRETRLVGTIFHELAHERLYVPGDSEFNEAFASVVEAAGVERWLEMHGRQADLDRVRLEAVREIEFSALLRATRDRLDALYRSGLGVEDMRRAKQREFGQLKFDYEQLRARWGGYAGYDAWFAQPLNNARLAAVATYRDCVPGLQREREQAGSLPAFYERASALARLSLTQRHEQVCRP